MPKIPLPSLSNLLHAFFHDWLAEQRNASHRTVLAYRDAWRLFLRFAAKHQKRPVTSLGLEHLSATAILAFLQNIEQEGKASIRTRNCRLAALRSFFSFVAVHEPLAARQCAQVRGIPFKRAPRRAVCYLESAEVSTILAQPNRTTLEGQRDHIRRKLTEILA